MLPYEYRASSPQEVQREFGERFAQAVFEIEPGDWSGPVLSGYGVHLVVVTDVEKSSLPELDDVMGYVLADYQRDVRQRAQDASALRAVEQGFDYFGIAVRQLHQAEAGEPAGGENGRADVWDVACESEDDVFVRAALDALDGLRKQDGFILWAQCA